METEINQFPPELTEKLEELAFRLSENNNNNNPYDTLLEWGQTLANYATHQLQTISYDDLPMNVSVENHLKECLFLACAKFQEASDLKGEVEHKLLELWGDTMMTISTYFNVPFFDFAIEKYEKALSLSPNSPKILRHYAIALSEQARFLGSTNSNGKFGLSCIDLHNLAEEKFTKALELKPTSFKTLVSWADALEKNFTEKRVFLSAVEISREIGNKYMKALEIKPDQVWCLDSWGRHLDSLVSLYQSCRRTAKNDHEFHEIMQNFLKTFLNVAMRRAVCVKPVVAFSLIEQPDIAAQALAVLMTLAESGPGPEVRQEARHQVGFVHATAHAKREIRAINCVKELFHSAPEGLQKLIQKSNLTEKNVAEHFNLFVNCLYFLCDKDMAKHPIFKHVRQGAGGTSLRHKHTDDEIDKLFKKENPKLYYTDRVFVGNGGFGDVFIAQSRKDGTRVAMKILKKKLEEDTYNIIKEIQSMMDCKHKYIVNFIECFHFKGTISVIMEYCDGGALKDLCSEVHLNEFEIAHFCRQILEGLQYLHVKRKKIHRDIKCDNILLNLNGDVRLADMGLIEHTKECTRHFSMVGTSYWMAPEIIAQQPYGVGVDIWSLGCVCFELSTGDPPYYEFGSLKSMYLTSTIGAPQLPHFNDSERQFSPLIHEFLDCCFQFNPQLRPSATELLKHPFLSQQEGLQKSALLKKIELVFIGSSLRMNGLI